MNQDVKDYFEVMKFAIMATDYNMDIFLKSPFSGDEVIGDNVVFSNSTYLRRSSYYWDVLMQFDGSVISGNCYCDGHTITLMDPWLSDSARKNYIKRLLTDLQKTGISDTTSLWPVFTRFACQSTIRRLKFKNIAEDMKLKIENPHAGEVLRSLVNFKMNEDYINEHPLTIEKIREVMKMKSNDASMNENPFIIENRKALFGYFPTLVDFINKICAENSFTYKFIFCNALRDTLCHDIYGHNDDTGSIVQIAQSMLSDDFRRRYVIKHSSAGIEEKANLILLQILDSSEWRDAFKAATILQEDESFPDVRYYIPLFI